MLLNPLQPAGAIEGSFSGMDFTGLGNRFIGLLGRKWSRRSFAAETAKLLAEATKARAVAILAYEPPSGRLALLADYGLTGEARLALGSANEAAWDIPLRGLQSRRISVIEAAQQNPNVPPALTKFSPDKLCIVCLPVYYGGEPVGAAIVFAPRNRAFSDAQLQTLSQALRVCGHGLRAPEAAPPRSEPGVSTPQPSPAVRAISSAGAIGDEPGGRLHLVGVGNDSSGTAAPAPAAKNVTDAERIQQEFGRAQAEMQRRSEALRQLFSANRALKAERDRLLQEIAGLEKLRGAETGELQRQLSNVEDRLLAAESERQRSHRAAEERRSGRRGG